VHRPPSVNYKVSRWPPEFSSSSFFSPSRCRGFTCISEDSSEITFLLVENYNLTAPSWPRPAGEFLEPNFAICVLPFLFISIVPSGERGEEVLAPGRCQVIIKPLMLSLRFDLCGTECLVLSAG